MNMKELRQYRLEGDQLVDLINDEIFEKQITGAALANALGKSEAQISFILNPLHQATWAATDLPVLMRMLDGQAIARVICGWIGQINANMPKGSLKHGHVMFEIGQLLQVISKSIDDGKLTIQEIQAIRNELLDVIGAVDTLFESKARNL